MAKLPRCPVGDKEKIAYPSWDAAVHRALIRSSRSGTALRPYRCPRGNHWHLTSAKEYAA